jgi:oligoribonuclease NrnB/cAMP/cGMP phosphodiesterase (DHH superfamily)
MRLLLTHTDNDGTGSAVLAYLFRDKAPFDRIVYWNYGYVDVPTCIETLRKYDTIVVADQSIPEALYDKLIGEGKAIEVYDHHDSSEWIIKAGVLGIHDHGRSGTKLFWEGYVKPRVPRYKPIVSEYVELVSTYDLWKKESPLWREATNLQRVWSGYINWRLMESNPEMAYGAYISAMVHKLQTLDSWAWSDEEQRMIDKAVGKEEEAYLKAVRNLQVRRDKHGQTFGVIRLGGKISLVCSRMLDEPKYDHLQYLACMQDYSGNWGKISLRSRGFDLTQLVGVEGHKEAAGTQISPDEADRFWENDCCIEYKSDLSIQARLGIPS